MTSTPSCKTRLLRFHGELPREKYVDNLPATIFIASPSVLRSWEKPTPRFYPTGLANRSHLPIMDYFSLARFQRVDFGFAPGPYHCSPPAALIPNLLSPTVLFRVG